MALNSLGVTLCDDRERVCVGTDYDVCGEAKNRGGDGGSYVTEEGALEYLRWR